MGNTKQKSILHYVFKYAGTYKVRYFISIAFALLGVCFSMIPFMLMGKLVENLVKGNRDFQYYKSLGCYVGFKSHMSYRINGYFTYGNIQGTCKCKKGALR